jgi:hypothetical protein
MLLLYYAAANTVLANHPKGVDRPPPMGQNQNFLFF